MITVPYSLKILAAKLAVALVTGLVLAFVAPHFAPLAGQVELIGALFVAAIVAVVNDVQTWLRAQKPPEDNESAE